MERSQQRLAALEQEKAALLSRLQSPQAGAAQAVGSEGAADGEAGWRGMQGGGGSSRVAEDSLRQELYAQVRCALQYAALHCVALEVGCMSRATECAGVLLCQPQGGRPGDACHPRVSQAMRATCVCLRRCVPPAYASGDVCHLRVPQAMCATCVASGDACRLLVPALRSPHVQHRLPGSMLNFRLTCCADSTLLNMFLCPCMCCACAARAGHAAAVGGVGAAATDGGR